jgi:hypothetical protein
VGIVAELMTENAKGARGIAETPGDLGGRLLVDKEGAEGFVLSLQRELRGEEEVLVGRGGYVTGSAGRHDSMVLQNHEVVNAFETQTRINVALRPNHGRWRDTWKRAGGRRALAC